jgi:hypothetical protein
MSAFTRQLIHTCSTRRPLRSQSSIGEKTSIPVDWLTDQPCRYVVKQEKFASETQGLIVQTVYLLLFAPGADVKKGDQIIDLTIEDGEVIRGPIAVLEAIPRRGAKGVNHLSVKLERVK